MGTLVLGTFGETIDTDNLDTLRGVEVSPGSWQIRAFTTGNSWAPVGTGLASQAACEARLEQLGTAIGWVKESDPLNWINPKRIVIFTRVSVGNVVEVVTEGGFGGIINDFLYIP